MKKTINLILFLFLCLIFNNSSVKAANNITCIYRVNGLESITNSKVAYVGLVQNEKGNIGIFNSQDNLNYFNLTDIISDATIYIDNDSDAFDSSSISFKSCPEYSNFYMSDPAKSEFSLSLIDTKKDGYNALISKNYIIDSKVKDLIFNSNQIEVFNEKDLKSYWLTAIKEEEQPELEETNNPYNPCDTYLGNPKDHNAPAYYLQFVFDLMKYAAIIMLFVLTIVEFVKATASSNQDAIKKAMQNTIKRLIIAIIIFLLPTIIKFLLTVLGAYSPSTCGIK